MNHWVTAGRSPSCTIQRLTRSFLHREVASGLTRLVHYRSPITMNAEFAKNAENPRRFILCDLSVLRVPLPASTVFEDRLR